MERAVVEHVLVLVDADADARIAELRPRLGPSIVGMSSQLRTLTA
jgi:hypothetical protein